MSEYQGPSLAEIEAAAERAAQRVANRTWNQIGYVAGFFTITYLISEYGWTVLEYALGAVALVVMGVSWLWEQFPAGLKLGILGTGFVVWFMSVLLDDWRKRKATEPATVAAPAPERREPTL